jgi:hypothetical protein
LVKQKQTHTVSFLSSTQFEHLKYLHSSNLICPCCHFSMYYVQILSVQIFELVINYFLISFVFFFKQPSMIQFKMHFIEYLNSDNKQSREKN